MTIKEIEERLSAIKVELEAEGADINALSKEADELLAERENIAKAEETRQAALAKIANLPSDQGETIIPKEDNDMSERTFTVDTMEYRDAFLKHLMGKELDEEERSAVTATAAIPTVTMNKIIGVLENTPLVAAVDVTYIPGNVSFPVENSVGDAAWVAMGTSSTDSGDSLTSVSLSAYKLVKTVEITADVQAMAIDAFESWLVSRLANKIAKAVDAGILNGHGSTSGECLGIAVSKSTEDGTYTKTTCKWSDFTSIIGTLKTEYHQNAKFVMGRTFFFNRVLGLENSQGNPIVVMDPQAPGKYNLLGFPVIVDDNVTSGDVYFGDLKAYKFNFAKAPEVTSDDSVAFKTGSRVYRAMALADGKLADSNAIVRFVEKT